MLTETKQEMVVISDEVVDRIVYLMEMSRDAQFAVGDEIISQIKLYGGKKGEVINYLAGKLNISASTLYDYCRIAERWSPEMRLTYQTLDWTIYRNANPNNPDDLELIKRAIDEGWNATKFKEEKYPAMQDISIIVGRIKALINRNLKRFKPSIQKELKGILNRLDTLMEEQT